MKRIAFQLAIAIACFCPLAALQWTSGIESASLSTRQHTSISIYGWPHPAIAYSETVSLRGKPTTTNMNPFSRDNLTFDICINLAFGLLAFLSVTCFLIPRFPRFTILSVMVGIAVIAITISYFQNESNSLWAFVDWEASRTDWFGPAKFAILTVFPVIYFSLSVHAILSIAILLTRHLLPKSDTPGPG